ncbi:DUF4426 domain-containing protein [Wenzhouxiangella marina]|uniref:Uncharacterized protein n=1 Tax=Wenzhouxiangella marina TaxID=1579979 RepID=A0A0K0XZF6_9GAMM|nr:DUF4426 domain-containing protein [Wenzhouxiangella marina]AKS43073.1 hypothetical protein WM2015_2715 [Wenzhouxiangella marina]MBB6087243.1 hypothetical protein [Wenzhouxiangella marina]
MKLIDRSAALSLMVATSLLFFSSLALAQQAEDFGRYEVHYSTLNTSLLTPEVARAYGLERSGNRAMVNITVLTKTDDGLGTPTPASVQVESMNLLGQARTIDMREIRDQDAIYYIGTFRISNEENINFNVTVQPEGEAVPRTFSFRQMFYVH